MERPEEDSVMALATRWLAASKVRARSHSMRKEQQESHIGTRRRRSCHCLEIKRSPSLRDVCLMEATKRLLCRCHEIKRNSGPLIAMAPMVRQSELAFRMMCRNHNVPLCYTPMIPAGYYARGTDAEREDLFQTTAATTTGEGEQCSDGEGPLVAQLCGNSREAMAAAAKLLHTTGRVDAIDVNLGCPQACAKHGGYGAFLLDQDKWPIVEDLVRELCAATALPVWCKIRLLPTSEATVEFARLLQSAGCSLLTVHGRLREQRDRVPADWDRIREVVEAVDIPVFANGSVRCYDEAVECQRQTGAAGVMVANGLLANPWAFNLPSTPSSSNGPSESIAMAREYLEYARLHPPPANFYGRCIRDHLQYMLEDDLKSADRALWGVLDNPKLASHRQFSFVLDLVERKLCPLSDDPGDSCDDAAMPSLREIISSSSPTSQTCNDEL